MAKKKTEEQKMLDLEIVRLKERVHKIEENHCPKYETVPTHHNLQNQIDELAKKTDENHKYSFENRKRLCLLEMWKREHKDDKRAVLSRYGIEAELKRLDTIMNRRLKEMEDCFENNYEDRETLRTTIDDSYLNAVQYVLNMFIMHEEAYHGEGVTEKENLEDEDVDFDPTDYNKNESEPRSENLDKIHNLYKARNLMRFQRRWYGRGALSVEDIRCIATALEYAVTLIK